MSAEFSELDPIQAQHQQYVAELRLANCELHEELTRVPTDPVSINEAKSYVAYVEGALSRLNVKYDLDHYHADRTMVLKGLIKSLWPFSRKGDN